MPTFRRIPETVEAAQTPGGDWLVLDDPARVAKPIPDRGDGLAPLGYEPVEAEFSVKSAGIKMLAAKDADLYDPTFNDH